jgi:hypothetical protein
VRRIRSARPSASAIHSFAASNSTPFTFPTTSKIESDFAQVQTACALRVSPPTRVLIAVVRGDSRDESGALAKEHRGYRQATRTRHRRFGYFTAFTSRLFFRLLTGGDNQHRHRPHDAAPVDSKSPRHRTGESLPSLLHAFDAPSRKGRSRRSRKPRLRGGRRLNLRGSLWTLCWSKADSNSGSHPRATPPAATRFVADSALWEDGFELSVPGDTIKVLRSLHVVPANAKSARTSSDTGEPAVGDRLPIVAHRMNGAGHRRPARSPPWSGDPGPPICDAGAGRAAVSSGFTVSAQLITLMSLFVGASGLSSC